MESWQSKSTGTGVAGTDFDQIVVNGTATLRWYFGTHFQFSDIPMMEMSLTIIDATALSGTFSSVTEPAGALGYKIQFTQFRGSKPEYTNPMPVTPDTFYGKKQDNGVKLDWQTSWESNNQGFGIERGVDGRKPGKHWVCGRKRDHNENNAYAFLDLHPVPGMNYYRLRQLISMVKLNSPGLWAYKWTMGSS